MDCQLTSFQEAFVLSLFPVGARVTSARYMQELVPCPMLVGVALPDGIEAQVVLRLARNRGGVEREALVLPALARLELPVPTVLAGPVSDPQEAVAMSVHSLLPGKTLQTWSEQSSRGVELAMAQLIEAVGCLHRLTDGLLQDEVGSLLPHKTLASELRGLIRSGNPWMQVRIVEAAAARIMPLVETLNLPLVFSNGDYQPANFLSSGDQLTGFVDFEKACFEDPLISLARYPVYSLNPLHQAGVVTRLLQDRGLSETDFAPRLVIFCLRTLAMKVPVTGGSPCQHERRDHVLTLLAEALPLLDV